MSTSELSRLYDAHAPALFAFLLNFLRDEAATRDVLQEVFLRLVHRPEVLDGVRDERGFLLRLAHNLAVDGLRRLDARRRAHAALAGETVEVLAPVPSVEGEDQRREVETALAALPADQRAVVQLKLWEGLTFERIAEVLDIPPNTAASRYRYALEKLRPRLRALYEELR